MCITGSMEHGDHLVIIFCYITSQNHFPIHAFITTPKSDALEFCYKQGWKNSEYEMTAFRYQDEKDNPKLLEIISKKTSLFTSREE